MALIQSILSFLRFNNKNWKVILLCIFAAAIFWIFNSLNKNYSASIDFPLAFDYDQESYVAVKSLPDEIKLNVTGLGWDLFRKSAGLKVPPLRIPLENPSEVKKDCWRHVAGFILRSNGGTSDKLCYHGYAASSNRSEGKEAHKNQN